MLQLNKSINRIVGISFFLFCCNCHAQQILTTHNYLNSWKDYEIDTLLEPDSQIREAEARYLWSILHEDSLMLNSEQIDLLQCPSFELILSLLLTDTALINRTVGSVYSKDYLDSYLPDLLYFCPHIDI